MLSIVFGLVPLWWIKALLVLVAAALCCDAAFRAPWFTTLNRTLRVCLAMLVGGGALLGGGYFVHQDYLKSNAVIHAEFVSYDSIYKQMPALGKPTSGILTALYAHVEGHEHAVLFWADPLRHLMRLNENKTFSDVEEPFVTTGYATDALSADALGLPPGCKPPIGGFAKLWKEHPPEWKPVGCRNWTCDVSEDYIRYQIFENGYVIDGVPLSDGKSRPGVYILRKTSRDGGVWTGMASAEKFTSCRLP